MPRVALDDSDTGDCHRWHGGQLHRHSPLGGYTRGCYGDSDTCCGDSEGSIQLRMCSPHRRRKRLVLPRLVDNENENWIYSIYRNNVKQVSRIKTHSISMVSQNKTTKHGKIIDKQSHASKR